MEPKRLKTTALEQSFLLEVKGNAITSVFYEIHALPLDGVDAARRQCL